MKTYISNKENSWSELINYKPTQEELAVIENAKSDEDKIKASKSLREKHLEPVSEEKQVILNSIYTYNKPVKEDESDVSYQLIEMIIMEFDNNVKGILNCRVNGEHKQVRF